MPLAWREEIDRVNNQGTHGSSSMLRYFQYSVSPVPDSMLISVRRSNYARTDLDVVNLSGHTGLALMLESTISAHPIATSPTIYIGVKSGRPNLSVTLQWLCKDEGWDVLARHRGNGRACSFRLVHSFSCCSLSPSPFVLKDCSYVSGRQCIHLLSHPLPHRNFEPHSPIAN